jgi:hypothetical protein
MRKKILELVTLNPDYLLYETVLSQEILLQADEVFLQMLLQVLDG